jgi:primosomal protein DnaI
MMKLAKNLSEKGAKVFIAYYPDLTRHLRSSVATGELEKMIIKLKNYDILMLDDIGADTNSAFIRDEILGPVLQYRLHANLPVCMTSNFSFSELRNHFMESKNDLDVLKSDRIIERLRYLMTEVKLADRNYRTGVEYQKKD